MSEDETESQSRVQPWRKTIAEIYDAVYCRARELLRNGAVLPCCLDNTNHVYLLTRPDHLRQVASPQEIQIHTENGWVYILPITVDEWARTFDMVGPTEYVGLVSQAIKENYPVPKEIQKAHKLLVAQSKGKEVKRAQLTRTIDEVGLPAPFDGLEKPYPGDVIYYNGRPLTITDVLLYHPEERMWSVDVQENRYRFIIQRQFNVDESKCWVVYTRDK